MRIKVTALLLFFAGSIVFAQGRSLEDLFPHMNQERREQILTGVLTEAREKDSNLYMQPAGEIGIKVSGLMTADLRPSCLVESLTVIPYLDKPVELLDIYNAMGKVRDLKGRLYHSFTRDENVPLFEDSTRVESPKRTRAIPDPAATYTLPRSDRIYVCLKDINFGNSYYQADISVEEYGLLYGLSNFKSLSYGIIPVIKEKKFNAQFYVEPLTEGVLVYSVAVAEVSDFIAGRINIPSAIRKRIEVILGWLIDNIAGS
ncbi:hypothetical protein TREPR_2409 [Treponema primitia ZAS-2]|uniref:Uncharacterized protein n=1 Tax=Treponema primitia (strain ATCC BAA-887 / DSM 12427 / ZAS-2) TaxID=545694 RepID=F5YHH0_TREPZ|nr:hypothetical protein TREPR_2409 [Treponema primitia ZAS-2]